MIVQHTSVTLKILILLQIHTLNKVPEYNINSQKSVALLYKIDKWTEKKIMEATSATIGSYSINYLGGNSNQASESPVR